MLVRKPLLRTNLLLLYLGPEAISHNVSRRVIVRSMMAQLNHWKIVWSLTAQFGGNICRTADIYTMNVF